MFNTSSRGPLFRPQQSLLYASLALIGLLVLTLAPGITGFPSREQVYRGADRRENLSGYVYQQLFTETKPVDVAILGSSHVAAGFHARRIQEALSAHLGRTATVVHLPSVFYGTDLHYILLRDLLAHRRVGLVLYDVDPNPHIPINPSLHRILQAHEHWSAFAGLPQDTVIPLFALTVLVAPRQYLAALLTRDVPIVEATFAKTRGSDWLPDEAVPEELQARLREHPCELDELLHHGRQDEHLRFDLELPDYQAHFMERIVELVAASQARLILVRIPFRHAAAEEVIRLPHRAQSWLERDGVPLLAVAPARFFASFNEAQIDQLYLPGDNLHFNTGGGYLHTRVTQTALLHAFDRYSRRPQ